MSTIDGSHIIVAADCTGHGVAGALMSMLGMSLLDQIVNQKGISEPSQILDELHTSVVESLKQRENDSSDGMDIAICKINPGKMEMTFAGANRPLWLVRNNELIITQPDKYPIGGLQYLNRESFNQQQIKLESDDLVYIFTDGYADQFGGDRNKKMMRKRFKELLLSIHKTALSEQENELKKFFFNWKGKNEQVDDILIVGLRI